jgi:hypothetical protein
VGTFLEPGEKYTLAASCGDLVCKALSFRQQRQLIKLIKEMQTNNDPVRAMDLIEEALGIGIDSWHRDQAYSVEALLDVITFQEATDLVKRITEAGRLSETDQKK